MILSNFKKIIWTSLANATYSSANITSITGEVIGSTKIPYFSNGLSIYNYGGGNTGEVRSDYSDYAYISLTFGCGTTEPTEDDYQMENPYDTTNHFSWANQVQSRVAETLVKVITASIVNTSEENLTVSEIGVMAVCNRSDSTLNPVLIARSLITPVTIEPNETKTFQYTIDFNGITG